MSHPDTFTSDPLTILLVQLEKHVPLDKIKEEVDNLEKLVPLTMEIINHDFAAEVSDLAVRIRTLVVPRCL